MHRTEVKKDYQYKYFTTLSMLYCTLLMVSVLLPYKIINFFGYSEPGGIFIFPLTYLLAGAIAENYGRKMALRMVYSSIFCLIVFNLLIAVIIRIPSIPEAPNQNIFIEAFGHSIRLSIGCVVGLICSDLTNVYKITRLKIFFRGKYFIQRLLWSTALSEGIFNIVTYLITYYSVIPNILIIKLIYCSWILKMLYSIFMLIPLLLFIKFLKKSENFDHQDDKNYNQTDLTILNPELLVAKFLRFV